MNEYGLVTYGMNMDNVLILFQAMVGGPQYRSNDDWTWTWTWIWIMFHGIELGPLRNLVRTLLAQGKPRQTQTCIYFPGSALNIHSVDLSSAC